MRPSRRRLEKAATQGLASAGFKPVPGPRDFPDTTQFWKKSGDLRLILALEYHRFYEEAFTGSLYLGRTFTFALYPLGYPQAQGWVRIGQLVPELGSADHWWTGFNDQNAEAFANAVPVFEARFLAQPGLLERVRSVEELRRLERLTDLVAKAVQDLGIEIPAGLSHQPKRIPTAVPPVWFWAAEMVIAEYGIGLDRINETTKAEWLAVDAWRCAQP